MAQQSTARSSRSLGAMSPTAAIDTSRDIYPVPPSPFPSVVTQKRQSGTPQSANPLAGPFSGSSITPDGSSFSSIFGGPVELPSATVAGSKRHTIAGLASLAAKRSSLPLSLNQRASTPVIVPPALPSPGTPGKFVPTLPSVAALTPPPGTTTFAQSQGTPTKGSPTASSHGLVVPPTGHTPITPAFPAYPDAPLPSSPLSQAPMQGLMAALGPALDVPSRDSTSSEAHGHGQRYLQQAPVVMQPVLVSVSLLPPDGSTDERIYPMNTFSLEIFVFNESDVIRRCEVSCPARKRWRQEAAQRSQDDSLGSKAGILPLENHIRIGPLRPGTCQSVRMRFLAIQPGSHSVDTLTLTDTETGFAINLRDAMNVFVHRRKERPVSQVATPLAELEIAA